MHLSNLITSTIEALVLLCLASAGSAIGTADLISERATIEKQIQEIGKDAYMNLMDIYELASTPFQVDNTLEEAVAYVLFDYWFVSMRMHQSSHQDFERIYTSALVEPCKAVESIYRQHKNFYDNSPDTSPMNEVDAVVAISKICTQVTDRAFIEAVYNLVEEDVRYGLNTM